MNGTLTNLEPKKDVASEYNPLYYQLDFITVTSAQRRSAKITVLERVLDGRLTRIEGKQVLQQLGLD